MAFNLFNPGTWGWGSDYATGQSASLKPSATLPKNASTNLGNGTAYIAPINNQPGKYISTNNQASTGPTTSNVNNSGGSVLGTSASAPSGPSPEEQAKQQYFSYLDQQAGMLPETQKQLESQVNNLFGSSQSSINTSTQSALGDLDVSRQKAESNKATSLRDLEENMRNQLTAGQRYLGSVPGSANSSAANMYNYALGKAGNKSRADLQRQANEIFSNIDNQANKVKQTAQDQLQQLETWKNNQLSQIAMYIQQQKGQIDAAKAQYIQSQLANIDAQASAYKQSLAQWAMNNSTNLESLRANLAQMANVDTSPFNMAGLPGLQMGAGQQSQGTNLFGSLLGPKDDRFGV